MPVPAAAAPWIPSAIAGGASILGGYLGNRAARQESARNRRFQERMRNTQWQAAVADMEKAGINPALAYSQGPAASPGGSMASQEDFLSKGVGSAMQARRLQADVKNLQAQYGLIKSQTLKEATTAQLLAAQAQSAKAKAQLDKFRATWMLGEPSQVRMGDGEWQTSQDSSNMIDSLVAELENSLNRAKREGATARSMEPIAKLADELGMWLPVIAMGGGVGGALMGGGARLARWARSARVPRQIPAGIPKPRFPRRSR